jgi:serine/threonine protein kinase/tetratricopeptide (TPR) repeat protein
MLTLEDQARALFLAALERAAHDWPAFLDEASPNEPELRARVRQLLRDHEALGSIHGTDESNLTAEAPPPEPLGALIGPYKLMEQIGEGGMGLVYVAEQSQPVRRKVALKLIKPGMDTRQVIARFEAERQALALMNHPNIAKVFDGGETPSGRPYFVMELVRGVPITEYCDQNRLTPRARLELFGQVCAAVQHAHQKGIIHRDIKPSNVMVVSHDGTPVVKVIDFGVAKAIGQQLTDKTVYTQFAQFIGTPLYMSPEQAGQSGIDIDTRTDIYALGVLLYELLTGMTPFDKERLSNASYDEIRRIVREEEPPKPSTRLSTLNDLACSTLSAQRQSNSRELSLLLRGELDWIVMKSLEKDRTRRYESPSALAADVGRYLSDETVQACPPSRSYLLGKFLRRRRRAVLTTAAALVAALALLGGGGWVALDRSARRTHAEKAVAQDLREAAVFRGDEQWAQALQSLERARGRLEGSGLEDLEDLVQERVREVSFVLRLEEAELLLANSLDVGNRDFRGADKALEEAFLQNGLDIHRASADEIAKRIRESPITTQLIAALEYWALVKRNMPHDDPEPLVAIARLADDDPWRQRLRDPKVRDNLQELIRLAETDGVLAQPPINLTILCRRIDAGAKKLKTDSPEDRSMRVKARAAVVGLLRQAQMIHPANFFITYQLAEHLDHKDPDHIRFMQAAMALHPKNEAVRGNLYGALGAGRNWSEAGEELRKALKVWPNDAQLYHILGNAFLEQDNLADAERNLQKAVALKPSLSIAHNSLGVALGRQDKWAEAAKAFQEAIRLNPDFAGAHSNLGFLFERQGKLSDAETAYQNAIDRNPTNPAFHHKLGDVLTAQKKWPQAVEALTTAIAFKSDDVLAHKGLGNALMQQGNNSAALAAFTNAIELKDSSYFTLSHAARLALIIGNDQDEKVAKLDSTERDRLRGQALVWLQARLAIEKTNVENSPKAARNVLLNLQLWEKNSTFGRVRGEAVLAKWPEAERQQWRKLWEDVEQCRKRATPRGFIQAWLVLSDFLSLGGTDGAKALDQQQLPDEAHLRPHAGDRVMIDGKERFWKEHQSAEPHTDFAALYNSRDTRMVVYAVCYLQAEVARDDLVLYVGSDDQAVLYVNGKQIYRQPKGRALILDEDPIAITLLKGPNAIVFKVVNNGGPGPFGSLRLATKDGAPVEDVAYRLTR